MKILHSADWHAHRDRWPEVCGSLDVLEETGRREGVDLFAISGDIAHGPLQDSERDIFDALCARVQRLANIAPVAMIYGTPSHDAPGSLEVFERFACEYGITILRPGIAYFLEGGGISTRPDGAHAILFGVPEPNKKWLLAEAGATGKDESDAAVRQAMGTLLLGLGGLRRQYPELPCVLLYHGQVSGAKTGTGYEAGSGIAVSQDDLKQVGADYYALGDIHEPQWIPGLPAYYPGSIYPINWGETHKAGCNLITFGARLIETIKRIDFPHPQRVTLTSTTLCRADVEGQLIRFRPTITQEQRATFSAKKALEDLLALGALPGSKVEPDILPTETVRAGEITAKRALRDKVVVWGENSEVAIPESALAKADELEREGQAGGVAGSGAYLRIDRLRLRGAIGIWKKSKKDEIDLNLEALGPGVFALVSPNGAGKTTILENLHPWPGMLTRDGALKDHFRLKDSARELWVTDERSGIRYRALISIRADIASGAAEYFLYRDLGAGEEPYPGINGRKEPYEAAIAQLFGSLEMYLQTAFVTQRPSKYAPELASATQGQRKALFVELSGISYLERYREAAKARGDALEGELIRLNATIAAAAGVDEVIVLTEGEILGYREAETLSIKDMQASVFRGTILHAEHEALRARVLALDEAAHRKSELEREIAELLWDAAEAESEAARYQDAVAGRGAAEAELARIEGLDAEATSLRYEKLAIDGGNHKVLQVYQSTYEKTEAQAKLLRATLEMRRRSESKAREDLAVAKAKLAAPVADTCPTCGQTLPEDRLEALKHAHKEAEATVKQLSDVLNTAHSETESALLALEILKYPEEPKPAPFLGLARLGELERELAFVDADVQREIIKRADEAKIRIEEALRRAGSARGQALVKQGEAKKLEAVIADPEGLRDAMADKGRELETEQKTYTEARAATERARASAEAAERALAAAKDRQAKRDEAQGQRDEKAGTRDDWRLLERAVGPTGIQALELDAVAPSIAAVSNKFLSVFTDRYQIEFRTTRIAGSGKKTKQIEDFEIMILDTESGDEQPLDSLSGGEAVWIRKALYDGFAIIRAQNTGVKFQTCFLDEADGALDPEARMLYLRMLEAAHKESGRYQTILVTHSKELQAMVEQTIDIAELGPKGGA
jgi:exonuclease SbcC